MGVCDIVLDRGRNRFIAAKAVEAAEGKEARISLLDLESGEQIAVLPWPETVSSLRFSPDGRVLVTASSNVVAAIWDVQNATLLHSLQNTSGAVLAIWGEAAGNGGRVAFGSTFDPVQVWDLARLSPGQCCTHA
jgi:WD40 repeat protein